MAIFGPVFNASRGMVPITYVIGLVAMVFTAMSYREMSTAFPIAGSVYSYAGRGLHPSAGFLAGWPVLLDYLLLPTLGYVVAAVAMHAIVPSIPQSPWVIGFIVSNTVVNLLGIETTARASRICLAVQLFVIKRRGRRFGVHLVSPLVGFGIIGFVLANADANAKVGGLTWLAIGALILIELRLAGRSPELELEV